MVKKIVVIGLILLLVAYGGTEVWVNNSAESAIAKKLKQDHPEASKVQARVSIPVLISLLGDGRIRRVGASAQHVRIATVPNADASTEAGQVFANNVDVELSGVRIDRDSLLQQKELQVVSIDHLDLTADITQNEASKMLAVVPGVRFEFLQDVVRITIGRIVIGGTFQVEGATLRFVPASQGELPAGLSPSIELGNLPLARCTSNMTVKVREGTLTVSCSQDNPPIGEA